MEELEQPNNTGSNESFGKFKDAESLMKAYSNLEAEFTKKSQRLASLENEIEEKNKEIISSQTINQKVDDFVTKFEMVKPFSSALKETLANDQNASLEDEALNMIANNYKTAEQYAQDDEFLNNYIFSNEGIRSKIIKDYISKVTQTTPIKVDMSAQIPLTPPQIPTTISEAGRIARSIIKQK